MKEWNLKVQNLIESHEQEINTIESLVMSRVKELVLKGKLKGSQKTKKVKAQTLSNNNKVLTK